MPIGFNYMSMFGPSVLGGARAPEPEEPPRDPYGFLMPRTYGGAPVDPADSRMARGQGLTALGAALLKNASAGGDLSAGLASGLSEYQQVVNSALERDRALRQERVEEARRVAQEADRDRAAELSYEANREELTAFKDTQDRGKRLRAATGKSAGDMVLEIEKVAGPDAPETRQARALAQLDGEADLNRLAILHSDATERSRVVGDARQAIGLAVEKQESLAGAPSAMRAERREDRRIDAYGSGASGRPPTVGAMEDDVMRRATFKFNARVRLLGDPNDKTAWDPATKTFKPAVSREQVDQLMREAEEEARREVYGGTGTPTTATPPAITSTPDRPRSIDPVGEGADSPTAKLDAIGGPIAEKIRVARAAGIPDEEIAEKLGLR